MTTDVTNVQNAYQMVLRMCVRAPLSLICAMAMTFFINAELSTVFLYAIVFLSIVLFIIIHFAPVSYTHLDVYKRQVLIQHDQVHWQHFLNKHESIHLHLI